VNLKKARVLLVDDDESFRRVQAFKLEQAGCTVTTCADGEAALETFGDSSHDVVITDIRMPGIDGLALLGRLRSISPATPVIVVTGHGTIDTAVEAMKQGAFDFLTKPFPGDHLELTLQRALEMADLARENRELRRAVEGRFSFENLIGNSPAMRGLYESMELAAPTSSTILVRGETGSGKELVARAIHYNSPRRNEPFVTVNCGALPETLIEAELFGHRKGAYTGADRNRAGKFETADGGTLFLDEIGEIPLDLQPKILRVLQDGEVDRIGEDRPVRVDVRVIAATHRDLERLIDDGLFRSDLYYRLAVVPLEVPPLRDRREDIPLLAQHFLSRMCERNNRPGLSFPDEAMPLFEHYSWPGNVRELENIVERMVVLSREDSLSLASAPEQIRRPPRNSGSSLRLPEEGLRFEDLEKDLIRQALERTASNQTRAAKLLGLTRNTLLYRMQKFGLMKGDLDD
jgi:DNA-binding NtrC family response regulator